jgi:uncharacterized delta-60 repeat protein
MHRHISATRRPNAALSFARKVALFTFTSVALIGWTASARAQSADNTLDLGLAGNAIHATAVQPDGKILVGGEFTNVLGVSRNNLVRLNTDGTLDIAFNPNPDGVVRSVAVQSDGKILVGGSFTTIGGQTRSNLARLDATSGAADSFAPNPNGAINAIRVQSDGQVLVAGAFSGAGSIAGQDRNFIARLDPVTGVPDAFAPNPSDTVLTLAVQLDGKILVGGFFTSIGGEPRNRIARVDGATGLADSFNPSADQPVFAIAVQQDGKILAGGGGFTSIGGQPRSGLARLDADTGLADSFSPDAAGFVFSIALQSDAKILVGGSFTKIGGETRNRIARLDPVSGLADAYDPNANDAVYGITVQRDGKILVGGIFTSIGGQVRSRFARLTNDTAALESLAITRTAVTWELDGATPRFTRVTFESSTDNVNYTLLGNATPAGSDWTLTGLDLPTGQSVFIRARGYHGSGVENGSESITESVQKAFLAAPLQLSGAVSRKTHGSAGVFDIPLTFTGNPAVENRSSGGAHTLVFAFNNNVVSGNATLTAGSGTAGTPTFSGNTMIVNLTGVTDVQRITVTLSGVTDTFGQVLPETGVSVNMLIGDINGNRTVNATDIGAVKTQSGAPVTGANFRADVAANGVINATDIGLVKSRSGQFLP